MKNQAPKFSLLNHFLVLSTVLLLAACQAPSNKDTTVDDRHTSQNALDWAGVYRGTLPCASCSGIDTQVIIHSDGHYSKQTHYRDRPGVLTEQGQIKWDTQGQNISLMNDDGSAVSHYWVVENALVQLDQKQQKITGEMAEHYRLEKVHMQLTNQSWQLLSMANETVTDPLSERVNISFDADGKISGQAPCNRYFAHWTRTDQQLTIEKVGATKMACPALKEEHQFFQQLAQVDNFQIKQNILLLKQGEEVLLSFKAGFEPKEAKD